MFEMLRHPAVQTVKVSVYGDTLALMLSLSPGVCAGQPLMPAGKAATLSGTLTVGGTIGGETSHRGIDFAAAKPGKPIVKLWAGRRTDDIEADRALDNVAGTVADARIAEIVRCDWLVVSDPARSERVL